MIGLTPHSTILFLFSISALCTAVQNDKSGKAFRCISCCEGKNC